MNYWKLNVSSVHLKRYQNQSTTKIAYPHIIVQWNVGRWRFINSVIRMLKHSEHHLSEETIQSTYREITHWSTATLRPTQIFQ